MMIKCPAYPVPPEALFPRGAEDLAGLSHDIGKRNGTEMSAVCSLVFIVAHDEDAAVGHTILFSISCLYRVSRQSCNPPDDHLAPVVRIDKDDNIADLQRPFL